MSDQIIKFTRTKELKMITTIGSGACGETVLLFDDTVETHFVCKKFSPPEQYDREDLYNRFAQEIKLLITIQHRNIVRIFQHYLYPSNMQGFILMEYIEGSDISKYLKDHPEALDNIFSQTIEGFQYLERKSILHRDIRNSNILVSNEGIVKIIDFGFSKLRENTLDFDKSIALNLPFLPPKEYAEDKIYNFGTEIYFVGQLFLDIITKNNLGNFRYHSILQKMCQYSNQDRYKSFIEIDLNNSIQSSSKDISRFNQNEIECYRRFSNEIFHAISEIEHNSTIIEDIFALESSLVDVYNSCMLEEHVTNMTSLAKCFVKNKFNLEYDHSNMELSLLNDFIEIYQQCTHEKKKIILQNITTKLQTIRRYWDSDEIPF